MKEKAKFENKKQNIKIIGKHSLCGLKSNI